MLSITPHPDTIPHHIWESDRPSTRNNPPTAITENSLATSFKSTCGAAADRRGPHQKVIGYSMYGSNFSDPKFYNKYLKWFGETLRTIPMKYPGWVVRIYHQLKSDDVDSWKALNDVLDLKGNGDHIDLCNATQVIRNRHLGDIFEMTWRWLPMLDDMVDTLMSRDSDSVIITREQDAVAEWLASNKTYHIMRDHPQHCLFFVGCCWGVKINQERSAIVAVAEEMFKKNHLHKKGYDQEILIKHFKTMAVKSMVAHDSYCCGKFPGSQPFPTPRQNGWFIGWQRKVLAELKVPCPENCRPHNLTGPAALADWSLC
ncbi:uncharacterized protein LOC124326279 isoform X2 [Daphnia pulicaria]|uniref:uncharacterized protein LOC124326279 isoform X2 n=1 Tax=Daphnia pulicaria TaxID=35523 RepID=UPI001EEA0CAE|nr:uncharacterized protein LOC124326279 isoform X2 [Daphnia pulicaria]